MLWERRLMVINQEQIFPEEIVIDVDHYKGDVWELYDILLNKLLEKKYRMKLYYATGMRSPHLYVYVPELKNLSPELREEYKKLFLKHYCSEADLNLAEEGRLISAKDKIHFKHNTKKQLIGFFNGGPNA